MSSDTTRRNFVKAAAATLGGAAVATTGITVASASEGEGLPAESADMLSNEAAGWYKGASALNSDDTSDWRSNSIEDFTQTKLFSGWDFGRLHLNHRMVKSSSGTLCMLTRPYGEEEVAKEVELLAKGGVEMVWYGEYTNTCPSFPRPQMGGRSLEEGYFQIQADVAHSYGSYFGYQLSTMGMSFSGFATGGLGDFDCAHAEDLTVDEIKLLQKEWADAAEYLVSCGVDAVELNCAGNNLGQAFLSRNRNARTDEYGAQSIENRARFVNECVQAIKERCPGLPVQVLINGLEANDKTPGDDSKYNSIEETVAICKALEAGGADSLHLRLGPSNSHVTEFATDLWFCGRGINGTTSFGTRFDFDRHWQGLLDGHHSGAGLMIEVAAKVKEQVSIPVGCVTFMDPAYAPDFFEQALQDNKLDFYLMTRPLYVEPDYINKLREGRIDEIRPCTRCLHCHFDYLENDNDRDYANVYHHCRVNACTYNAYSDVMPEGVELPPLEGEPKKVMVVGGGAAGMEAARIAALRGHDVTLYEKNGYLGGLLMFADAVKGPHEHLSTLNSYLQRQLEVTGVNVITSTEVDAALVAAEAPDAVVIATGGRRPELAFASTAGTNAIRIDEVPGAEIGNEVVIVGGNAQAVDMAMYLMEQGKHVNIVTPGDEFHLGAGHSAWVKDFEKPIIYALGTRVWDNAFVAEVGEGCVTIIPASGVETQLACDTLVDCSDQIPSVELASQIDAAQVFVVGDAFIDDLKPRNIAEAILTGNLAGRRI